MLLHTYWAAAIWMTKGHDWICCRRQGEGREEAGGEIGGEKKAASPAVSSTRTGIWLFWLSSLLEKLCRISGERHRVRQLPAGPCRPKRPHGCMQAAPGLRAQTRWCSSSVFISLAINKGNTTDRGFFSPFHLTYLGYYQGAEFDCHHGYFLELYGGVQRHKQKRAFHSIIPGRTIWWGREKKEKKKAVKQCHNNMFGLLKIRTIF